MSLGLLDHHKMMAGYNEWMNARLVALLKDTSDEVLLEPRGAFFGSVLGTLNHIYVADLLWLRRLQNHPSAAVLQAISAFETPNHLDEVIFERLSDFAPSRARLDALIIRYIDSLTEADLATPLSFRRLNGDAHRKLLGLTLSHMFNHQTHHRGQVTTLLSQMGLDIGVTDLLVRVPELDL
jgi:uncharacterized damage-inducible protein DinB